MKIQINSIVDGVPTGVDLDTGNEVTLEIPPDAVAKLAEAIDEGMRPILTISVTQ